MDYLKFLPDEAFNCTHKTKRIDVVSLRSDDRLGVIRWHNGWREYVFEPDTNTFYSGGCIDQIRGRISTLEYERKRRPSRDDEKDGDDVPC